MEEKQLEDILRRLDYRLAKVERMVGVDRLNRKRKIAYICFGETFEISGPQEFSLLLEHLPSFSGPANGWPPLRFYEQGDDGHWVEVDNKQQGGS